MRQFFNRPSVVVPLVLIFNTIAIMWPGFLIHLQQNKPLLSGVWWLALYLIISELWQIMSRQMYTKKKQFTWIVYGVKFILSLLLIFIIACQSRWSIGILLVMYELYQALLYRNRFGYIETPYYPILSGFFKGFIMNMILAIGYPFALTWSNIQPFVMPFFIFMIAAIFYQIICTHKNKTTHYMVLTGTFIVALIFLIFISFKQPINLFKLVLFVLLTALVLFGFKHSKHQAMEQELYISLYTLLGILICH